MARNIKVIKDMVSPNGKTWSEGLVQTVGDELAQQLIAEGKAAYYDEDKVFEEIKKLVKPKKK